MKVSSKKTMLTAAVLVTLSSGTALAATPGTVDAQELFRSDRLVTDRANQPAVEETADAEHYEASISAKRSAAPLGAAHQTSPSANVSPQLTRLRWESVDTHIAERNQQPVFMLSAQKAKPVIITAADVKHEKKQAVREGRPPQELVGAVNMQRETPPQQMPPQPPMIQETPAQQMTVPPTPVTPPSAPLAVNSVQPLIQPAAAETTPPAAQSMVQEQKPIRPCYQQMPHESFSLSHPAENGAAQRQPEQFNVLGENPTQRPAPQMMQAVAPAAEHSVRPAGVPSLSPLQPMPQASENLAGISDEVRRHILAGQLAMEVQLRRDPSISGMRSITKVLRENTTLTRLQKIDFLIGFGRALHQSGLPRQQEALLIKTIAEAF